MTGRGKIIRRALAVVAFSAALQSGADIVFTDVSEAAGFVRVGTSFGASWGDFDGDHWPDLWAGNHAEPVSLYINQRDGTFVDVAADLFEELKADRHGASWADFDNDGDQDLLVTVGAVSGSGEGPNEFYVNENGVLVDEAAARGLDYPLGRGRSPLWLDWNADGTLDVAIANIRRSDGLARSALFTGAFGQFVLEESAFSLAASTNNFYVQLVPLDVDNEPLLLLHNGFPFPEGTYRLGQLPLQNVETDIGLPNTSFGIDSSVADFDGNGTMDIFLTRSERVPTLFQDAGNSLRAWLRGDDPIGLDFRSAGTLVIEVAPPWLISSDEIYIGGNGYSPQTLAFKLNSADPGDQGAPPVSQRVGDGLSVWYDTATGLWHLLAEGGANFNVRVTADQPVTDVAAVGFVPGDGAREDRLFMNTGTGFVDMAGGAGIGATTACETPVAADFDNDMDMDIFLVCQDMVRSLPKRLYENQGDGTFQIVADAGGAGGGSAIGRGETVALADYDRDGRLDMFVTNGLGTPPFDSGPDELFRNESTGDNRWLQVDLEGVVSNRDGIGARVFATTDGVTQMRLADGGMHRFSQNSTRLHFGLGQNDRVDLLKVEWPSGVVQEIADVAANQLIRIVEPSTEFAPGRPEAAVLAKPGVHVWRESSTGPFTMLVTAGNEPTGYQVFVLADAALEVSPLQRYQSAVIVNQTANSFTLGALLQNSERAVRFQTTPGSKALVAVRVGGRDALHLLRFGGKSAKLSPAGWLKAGAQLPALSDGYLTNVGGLYFGLGSGANDLRLRWSGHGWTRRGGVGLIASQPLGAVTSLQLVDGDSLGVGNYALDLAGSVSTGWKGVDVDAAGASLIGLTFLQEDTLSWHDVNPDLQALGAPNAAWLPAANPAPKPAAARGRSQ